MPYGQKGWELVFLILCLSHWKAHVLCVHDSGGAILSCSLTYRNVDSAFHRIMGISDCEKVYSSISASFSHRHSVYLSLLVRSLLPLGTWCYHGCFFFFFPRESLFEWQWFSSEVVISLNMSHATSRDPFQQIKMSRNSQGSKYIRNFIFVLMQTSSGC